MWNEKFHLYTNQRFLRLKKDSDKKEIYIGECRNNFKNLQLRLWYMIIIDYVILEKKKRNPVWQSTLRVYQNHKTFSIKWKHYFLESTLMTWVAILLLISLFIFFTISHGSVKSVLTTDCDRREPQLNSGVGPIRIMSPNGTKPNTQTQIVSLFGWKRGVPSPYEKRTTQILLIVVLPLKHSSKW